MSMKRNLLNELLSKKQPDSNFRKQSSTSCQLHAYCGVCGSAGYTVGSQGAFARATKCECLQSCVACYGRGQKANEKNFVKECRTLNPNLIIQNFNAAKIPARYANAAFESFRNYTGNSDDVLVAAKKWVEAFTLKTNKGILFSAPIGVGKTYILVSICRALILRGFSVRFIDFFQLLSELKSYYSEGQADKRLLDPMLAVDVLVVDELGKGRNSEWEQTILDQLVMGRYNEGKVLVSSTNYSLAQQHHTSDNESDDSFNPDRFGELIHRVGYRTFSRLRESCHFIDFAADNYRLLNHLGQRSRPRNK